MKHYGIFSMKQVEWQIKKCLSIGFTNGKESGSQSKLEIHIANKHSPEHRVKKNNYLLGVGGLAVW